MKTFFTDTCREYSLPLILGVICAMLTANIAPEFYHHVVHAPILGGKINLHWLVNDIFMVFFFATAGVEIINSLSRGGALNPIKRAITPLMATVGGVLGPVVVFFFLNPLIGDPSYTPGWGVCTATDIALAWLIAKLIFGSSHPAVKFLLLLAVVDDGIGLAIIAVFYPEPGKELQPVWLLLIPVAMLLAWVLGRLHARHFMTYVVLCGTISWIGMYNAGVHAALSLIFIVPFLPRAKEVVPHLDAHGVADSKEHTVFHSFEHHVQPVVDYGLFFFGFTAAGVEFSNVSSLSMIIFFSFCFGKTFGIFLFTLLSIRLQAMLPEGMTMKDVIVVGMIAGIGLTVALFVSENAFVAADLLSASKMGALFSILMAIPAIVCGRILKVGRSSKDKTIRL